MVTISAHICRKNSLTAHLVSRAKGANFVMYLADMKANGSATAPGPGIERCMKQCCWFHMKFTPLCNQLSILVCKIVEEIQGPCAVQIEQGVQNVLNYRQYDCRLMFVLDGIITLHQGTKTATLHADDYAYMPPDTPHRFALGQRKLPAQCNNKVPYFSLKTSFDHLLMSFWHYCVALAMVAGT